MGFDEEFKKRHGPELDGIAEEIIDLAGTQEAHWSVLLAASQIIQRSRLEFWERGYKAGFITGKNGGKYEPTTN